MTHKFTYEYLNYVEFLDKKLIHFAILKNGSVTQMHLAYEPEDWENFKSSDPPPADFIEKSNYFNSDNHDISNSSPQETQKYFETNFPNYFYSCFIRDPIKRFPSAIAQDYVVNNPSLPSDHNNLVDLQSIEAQKYLRVFEEQMSEFAKNPNFDDLPIVLDTQIKDFGHCRTQDRGQFEHMPQDVIYFEVDKNLTSNYRHWLFKNGLTKYQGMPDNSRHWHRNNSEFLLDKGAVKKIVMKYMTKESTLMEWILDYYAEDIKMYNNLKPLCYREGQNSQS